MSCRLAAIGVFTSAVALTFVVPAAAQQVSIWSGVYSKAQAERGAEVQANNCGKCHGPRLNGAGWPDQPPSPAIAREGFLKRWEGKPLAELFTYIREMMPADNPGTLNENETADAIANMLAVSNVPVGEHELPADRAKLEGMVIHSNP